MTTVDYSLSNSTLYPASFLTKKAYKLFITIPHTDTTVEETLLIFKTYKQVTYCKVAQEHHEDGDTHLHIFVSFKLQVKYSTIFNLLKILLENKRIQGTINFQIPKNSEAVCQYIDKEGHTGEFGERPARIGKSEKYTDREIGYKEAIEESKKGNVGEAMEILLTHQPRDMLINGQAIEENLKKLNQTREKFAVPVYDTTNTTLKEWQKKLLGFVTETPKARRIIWVVGEPESGKSFMFNYLNNLDNYKYGLYNAGQCVSMDNLVYAYDEEGIIAWDFPMGYDWASMESHTSNIIEKFSDFGQSVSSKKYKGNTKVIRGHCVVFSNREPLEGLQHRDVVVIRARKEENKKDKLVKTDKTVKVLPDNHCVVDKVDKVLHEIECRALDKVEFNGVKVDLFNPPLTRLESNDVKAKALFKRLETLIEHNMNEDEQQKIIERLKELGHEVYEESLGDATVLCCSDSGQ